MPRPALPPTPGSSTDITGKDGLQQSPALLLPFELPPPAIYDASRRSSLDATSSSATRPIARSPFLDASRPMHATESVGPRRPSTAARKHNDASFTLPPPPTRSRKIIQMNPRQQAERDVGSSKKTPEMSAGIAAPSSGRTAASATSADKGKRKQPSSSSAAGRKIARKTAHSLIERRRRTKMNEEFAVLKGMIPACTGEMHKLAILQVFPLYHSPAPGCKTRCFPTEADAGLTGLY